MGIIKSKHSKLIKEFFEVAKKMKSENIIKSSKYVGDIGEFICSNLYGIKLCVSQRHKGYDGIDHQGKRVEIKFHNGEDGTNIQMDKYIGINLNDRFQTLYVVLGPESKIRPKGIEENTYLIYIIENYVSGNIAKKLLSQLKPDKILNENLAEL